MSPLPTILVTGANGQLGKEMKQLESAYPGFRFVFLSREDMPIHHFELVRNVFKGFQPQFLINCAAYTAVDKAETEKDLAFQVNAEAVGVLAAVCSEYGTKFIHISTDYVFDGSGSTPYTTDAPTNPQSVYGASKLKGEEETMRFNPESIIIRTSWVYSEFGKNFVKTMRKLMEDRKELRVVNDQFGSPTYAADLAAAIMQIINSKRWIPGIYHYCNSGVISWYEFAVAIRDLSGLDCQIHPIPSSEYPTPAKRPFYSVLDTSKIQSDYGILPKNWRESLQQCLKKL